MTPCWVAPFGRSGVLLVRTSLQVLSEDGGEAVVRRRDDAMQRHLVGDLETGGFAELLYPVATSLAMPFSSIQS